MASGVTRSSLILSSSPQPDEGSSVDIDVGGYVAFEDLVASALSSGCECDVCEALRAANVTALGNHWRYNRVTRLVIIGVGIVTLLLVITILDIFFNVT